MYVCIYLSTCYQPADSKEVLHVFLTLMLNSKVFAIKDLNQFFYFNFFLPSPLT